jgi:lipocalin
MGQSLGHPDAIPFQRDQVSEIQGIWYEIAVIKKVFEGNCLGAIAAYSGWKSDDEVKTLKRKKEDELGKDTRAYADWYRQWRSEEMDTFQVTNYCVFKSPDGKVTDWACQMGKATKIPVRENESSTARFVVQFSKLLPFDIIARAGGNYIVVEADLHPTNPLNSYLVVWGGQDRFFWILSRSSSFSKTSQFEDLKEKYKPWIDRCEIRDPAIYSTFKNWSEKQCMQNPGKQEHN